MVESMIPGSVIVDLAAEGGGNCELTKPGEFRVYKKVTIIGFTDLPSRLPTQASQLFSNNTARLIQYLNTDGKLNLDLKDEITGAITVVHDGKVLWDPESLNKADKKPVTPVKLETVSEKISELPIIEKEKWSLLKMITWLSSFVLAALIGYGGSSEFLSHITVFVLACFVGFMLVWNVSPALHTPLMSVTNAISGIIVIGGMIHLSGDQLIMPAIAVLIATINIVGGFMVPHRMLEMFRK